MITLALVLTPVASAQALAALCALDGIDVDVVPSSRGAVAVRAVGTPGPGAEPAGGANEGRGADPASEPTPEVQQGAVPAVPDDLASLESLEAELGSLDWDPAELLEEGPPAEAKDLAARISRLTKLGVVLVTARLSQEGGLGSGLSGQVSAMRFAAGQAVEDLPAGLVLAGADDVVEDLLLGRRSVVDIPGHVSSRDAGKLRRSRWFGKGLGRPKP